ncbi:Fic/DOC family protein [Leucobacter tenebrionis]|uniref:Fic/DOC family protein n=1 Tax=Leucobacter tenebrionis TaxID=2873270 RepID=UPI001CA750A1|nr:Fic family protein [Leucobacter tenebrionis]QZY51405.1 Fic family protein [Leucobacter tenebrionis]
MSLAPDPYIDGETGVLWNLVEAETRKDLAAAESDLTTARTVQLLDHDLIEHTRDLLEVCALHRQLFQDVYAWAGEIRTIDMRRGEGHFFAPCGDIELNAHHIFASLRRENCLKGLGKEQFLVRLADFYDQLNYVHPFREGNGRTQRLFWSRVAFDAGWVLDWRPIHGGLLDEVSRLAREERNLLPLREALEQCLFPLSRE